MRLLELPKLVHQPLREDPCHVEARGRSTFDTPEPQLVLNVIGSLAGALECRSAAAAACVRRSCPTPRPRSRPRTPSSTPCSRTLTSYCTSRAGRGRARDGVRECLPYTEYTGVYVRSHGWNMHMYFWFFEFILLRC